MKISGPILAAITLDPSDGEVLRQAAEYAKASRLVVCHVLPEIYGIRPLFPQLRESDRPVAEKVRRSVAAGMEQQVHRVLGDSQPRPELRVESGSPHAVVLQVAEEIGAGLIVVGAGSQGGASLGGVSERIVRHASVPVLIARPPRGRLVLAATDFSDPALPAVELGRDEARRRGERFVVLHAVEVHFLPADSPWGAPTVFMSQVIEAETQRAQMMLAELAKRYGPDETVVTMGPPADAILEDAVRRPADLIVVGTHGRTGLTRITLGSVAEQVVRKADCSVLVVRLSA
jgi:nucleotide-binding universal stress UspA family protein